MIDARYPVFGVVIPKTFSALWRSYIISPCLSGQAVYIGIKLVRYVSYRKLKQMEGESSSRHNAVGIQHGFHVL